MKSGEGGILSTHPLTIEVNRYLYVTLLLTPRNFIFLTQYIYIFHMVRRINIDYLSQEN